MWGQSAAPFLVLFEAFSIMFGLFLSQFFVFLADCLLCTHLNFKENTAIATPRGSEVCAPRQKCATHRLLLVSAATTCTSLFLLFICHSILYHLYTPYISNLHPGNTPAFMLVPQLYPTIDPPLGIPHPPLSAPSIPPLFPNPVWMQRITWSTQYSPARGQAVSIN